LWLITKREGWGLESESGSELVPWDAVTVSDSGPASRSAS
jgi:hypothetical protein